MKILFIFMFLLSSLYADEAQRIETIIKDVAQLRGDYEKCQAKLQSKEALSAQNRSYVAPKIKEDSSKSRELSVKITKLEKIVKEQEKLLKAKENRINSLASELKICNSKADTEQKKHKNELVHQKNIAKIENFKFASKEQPKEKIVKKEQPKVVEKPMVVEKPIVQSKIVKKEQPKLVQKSQPKVNEEKKEQPKPAEKTLSEGDVMKKLQEIADKHRPENSSKKADENVKSTQSKELSSKYHSEDTTKKTDEGVKSLQSNGTIKFEPTSFRLNARSSIFDGINGNKVDEWDKDRTFTSNQKTDKWIKITGYFIDRKWQSASEQMWIREKDVFKKNIKNFMLLQDN